MHEHLLRAVIAHHRDGFEADNLGAHVRRARRDERRRHRIARRSP